MMPQIITQIETNLHTSWQKELAQAITTPEQLLQMLAIDSAPYQHHFAARRLFPMRVPRPFIAKMKPGDINDPLLKQVLPLTDEFSQMDGFVADPLQEHQTVAEGLLHKYKNRVLLITKAGCAINCRYCFRRHFPYQDNSPNKQRWQQALDYITNNQDIVEVILSGGDPLMANDEQLGWLLQQIEHIPHIARLRIHTRLPVTIPQRITQEFVALLQQSRLKAVIVFHINHPQELDESFKQAIEPLINARIPLFNQSVLLKGINDHADILTKLSENLFDYHIQPYYLHLLDKVEGASHFYITDEQAKKIYQQLLAQLPGFMVPKLVREIAGEPNKTPINLA
jgi:EF-P beta-lysylation protein EpmB